MSVYSTEKLVSEARRLATEFRRVTGKPLGISSEIAEFDAARILDLELCQERAGGYDAVGRGSREGKRVQIKGRAVFDEAKSGQRVGQLKTELEWDSVVLVVMDEEYQPVEIYECERADALAALADNKSTNRHKRGAMSLAKFKIISKLVWAREEGPITDEIWDNKAS